MKRSHCYYSEQRFLWLEKDRIRMIDEYALRVDYEYSKYIVFEATFTSSHVQRKAGSI